MWLRGRTSSVYFLSCSRWGPLHWITEGIQIWYCEWLRQWSDLKYRALSHVRHWNKLIRCFFSMSKEISSLTVCRIYKKVQIVKTLLWMVFHKVIKFIITGQLTQLNVFSRESGEILHCWLSSCLYWLLFTGSVKFDFFILNKMLSSLIYLEQMTNCWNDVFTNKLLLTSTC